MLTRYEKYLADIVRQKYSDEDLAEVIELLCRKGIIDMSMCKVLAVRNFVEHLVRHGSQKVEAMWSAAEYFCATYEYVRKCMYYYKDVSL